MQEVDLDRLTPETAEAGAAPAVDLVAAKARAASGEQWRRPAFVATITLPLTLAEGSADQRLVACVVLILGCVDPIDSRVERGLDHMNRAVDVRRRRPPRDPARIHPEPTAETDTPLRPNERIFTVQPPYDRQPPAVSQRMTLRVTCCTSGSMSRP